MLTVADVKLDRRYKLKALEQAGVVFRHGIGYVRFPPRRAGLLPVVWEFVKAGKKFQAVACGRHDYPSYDGLFPPLESGNGLEKTQGSDAR